MVPVYKMTNVLSLHSQYKKKLMHNNQAPA